MKKFIIDLSSQHYDNEYSYVQLFERLLIDAEYELSIATYKGNYIALAIVGDDLYHKFEMTKIDGRFKLISEIEDPNEALKLGPNRYYPTFVNNKTIDAVYNNSIAIVHDPELYLSEGYFIGNNGLSEGPGVLKVKLIDYGVLGL